jgi:hypothetical protein
MQLQAMDNWTRHGILLTDGFSYFIFTTPIVYWLAEIDCASSSHSSEMSSFHCCHVRDWRRIASMNDPIASLLKRFPPPSQPVERTDPGIWQQVEKELNSSLPQDYKKLVDQYGSGSWLNYLWVFNPQSKDTKLNLLDQIKRQLYADRMIKKKFNGEIAFPLFPDVGGLLPWAITENRERLYWLTEGDSLNWPTIIYESRGSKHEIHTLTCTALISGWVSGEISIKIFADHFEFGIKDAFQPLK